MHTANQRGKYPCHSSGQAAWQEEEEEQQLLGPQQGPQQV